jgi:hypothetical protein
MTGPPVLIQVDITDATVIPIAIGVPTSSLFTGRHRKRDGRLNWSWSYRLRHRGFCRNDWRQWMLLGVLLRNAARPHRGLFGGAGSPTMRRSNLDFRCLHQLNRKKHASANSWKVHRRHFCSDSFCRQFSACRGSPSQPRHVSQAALISRFIALFTAPHDHIGSHESILSKSGTIK